jgi:hypothetical protein
MAHPGDSPPGRLNALTADLVFAGICDCALASGFSSIGPFRQRLIDDLSYYSLVFLK